MNSKKKELCDHLISEQLPPCSTVLMLSLWLSTFVQYLVITKYSYVKKTYALDQIPCISEWENISCFAVSLMTVRIFWWPQSHSFHENRIMSSSSNWVPGRKLIITPLISCDFFNTLKTFNFGSLTIATQYFRYLLSTNNWLTAGQIIRISIWFIRRQSYFWKLLLVDNCYQMHEKSWWLKEELCASASSQNKYPDFPRQEIYKMCIRDRSFPPPTDCFLVSSFYFRQSNFHVFMHSW